MNLLAKNKISSYLEKHPEATVTLITWIKEFSYVHERRSRMSSEPVVGCTAGVAYPDLGDYCIKFTVNISANITLITWVGSKDEFQKEMDLKYAGSQQMVNKVEVIVVPPPPKHLAHRVYKPAIIINADSHFREEQGFSSAEEYEQALARLIVLIDAQRGSAAFDEILALLPANRKYEANQLNFPRLKIFQVVQHRMEMFQLTPSNLAEIAGGEVEMNGFLTGEIALPEVNLSRLCKTVSIAFPISDQHYLS